MASHSFSPQAHSRAVAKYSKLHYDRIEIRYTKESGMKQAIADHAALNGEETAVFIKRAIAEAMENDNKKEQP